MLKIVGLGRGRTRSKGIKTPGSLQEHRYTVLVFSTLPSLYTHELSGVGGLGQLGQRQISSDLSENMKQDKKSKLV